MGSILTLLAMTKPSIIFQSVNTLKRHSCCFNGLTWKSGKRDSVTIVIYESSRESHTLDCFMQHLENRPVYSCSSEMRCICFPKFFENKLNWRSEERNTFFVWVACYGGVDESKRNTTHLLSSCPLNRSGPSAVPRWSNGLLKILIRKEGAALCTFTTYVVAWQLLMLLLCPEAENEELLLLVLSSKVSVVMVVIEPGHWFVG